MLSTSDRALRLTYPVARTVFVAILLILPAIGRAQAEVWCLCSAAWGPRQKVCLAPDCSVARTYYPFSAISRPFTVAVKDECAFNSDSSPAAKKFYSHLKKNGYPKLKFLICSYNSSEFSADSAFENALQSPETKTTVVDFKY